jgi:hypothetical protein
MASVERNQPERISFEQQDQLSHQAMSQQSLPMNQTHHHLENGA